MVVVPQGIRFGLDCTKQVCCLVSWFELFKTWLLSFVVFGLVWIVHNMIVVSSGIWLGFKGTEHGGCLS